jgi:hypothetical protein
MSDLAVNALIDRLVKVDALDVEHFGDLLGVDFKQADTNPFWTFYEFGLDAGPFSEGELRLNAAGDGALLILDARDPPGLGMDDIDREPLGPRQGALPNPRILPEGLDTEIFEVDGVTVSIQWTHTTRKLTSVILEWTPPSPEETAAS